MAYVNLLLVGTIGLLMQLAQTRAFGKGAPLLTAALQYSTIIFAMVLGVLFWDNVPDALAWTGIGLIILAGLISAWSTARQAAPA